MPALYVENVPKDLYEALRKRAKSNSKSIAAEVIELLRQNVPTAADLKRRRELFDLAMKMSKELPSAPGPFPSTVEMLREDRDR